MTIEEALILLEHEYLEKDIRSLSPKDRLNFWASLKEFERPKIQRSVFEPVNNNDFKIEIEYGVDKAKTHQGLSQPVDKTVKN